MSSNDYILLLPSAFHSSLGPHNSFLHSVIRLLFSCGLLLSYYPTRTVPPSLRNVPIKGHFITVARVFLGVLLINSGSLSIASRQLDFIE